LRRQHGESLVLGREESTEGAGRRMHLLICEQRDLTPESVECASLERPADEVRAEEEGERHGDEHGGADREAQPCLQ
jgi:hypothetical protein